MSTQPPSPIRLLVVDDHQLFRRGLIALLGQDERFLVVGEAGDASQAQHLLSRCAPDLVLLDNHLPGVHGVDAIQGLKEAAPQVRVVMLTVSEDAQDLAAGLRNGADGYLLKTIDTAELCDSIQRIWDGDSVISPQMMGKMVSLLRAAPGPGPSAAGSVAAQTTAVTLTAVPMPAADDPIHSLSPRESDILRLIAKGDSNKHIARALDIAETTVKIHVQHILRKLGLSNRVHAAVYATERGVV